MKTDTKNTPAKAEKPISLDPGAIDPDAIESVLRIGGAALLERLVNVAEENVRRRLDELDEALASKPADLHAAERAAHSVKSSAAYLGVEALRSLAEGMELDSREGRPEDLPARAHEARRLLDSALPVLRQEVERRRRDEARA